MSKLVLVTTNSSAPTPCLLPLKVLLSLVAIALATVWAAPSSASACSPQAAISINCGSAPSTTFDDNGRLWIAFVQNQQVFVSHSDDFGNSYSDPVAVNEEAEDVEFNGENRPKIIVDGESTIYLSWTRKTSPRFTGEIRFSRSVDGGKSFQAPVTVNDDGLFTGHRFESLSLTESGHLYLTWIDKRDLEASMEAGEDYAGAAVYYAVSTDQGVTFSENHRVANHSCECCRIAMAPAGSQNMAILWRQIFAETTRDHAIAILTPAGETLNMNRASYDEWQIDACPHHGPSMIQSTNPDEYHLSWFTNGDLHQGIYYGRYSFTRQATEQVLQIDANAGAGHPYLAQFEDTLYLIWKGFDGEQSLIKQLISYDNGNSWSPEETLISTTQASDYPLLVSHADGVYLSWQSDQYGFVFKKLDSIKETASD